MNETAQVIDLLLVEDSPDDREMALHSLKKHRLSNRILAVKDGEEALDFLFNRGPYSDRNADDNPRVVLLDVKLPKIDGLEVLRQIRKNEKTRYLPVVMLTSSDAESDLVKSYQLGANSYIVKPVDFRNFTDTVSELGYYWAVVNKPIQDTKLVDEQ